MRTADFPVNGTVFGSGAREAGFPPRAVTMNAHPTSTIQR